MRRELFLPSAEGEARLLLLITAFTGTNKVLEGRTKLAKLDFLLRYTSFFQRALAIRTGTKEASFSGQAVDIETRMVRYRFGPWDPAYFSLLGRLIGRGLVTVVPTKGGAGYKATAEGLALASRIAESPSWRDTAARTRVLRKQFDLSGTSLKNFIYGHFPEVVSAAWGESL